MPVTQREWDDWNRAVYTHCKKRNPERHQEWHEREFMAQQARIPLSWHNEPFWRGNHDIYCYHFAHTSAEDPMLVAYTVDNERGEKNIQTKIKPGRYLSTFFKGILSEKEIAYLAAQHAAPPPKDTTWSDYELKFAMTAEEMIHAYLCGPHSCMDDRHFSGSNKHPVRAYAAGDLAIAYLEGPPPPKRRSLTHTVVARALVWPDKKVAGRVYPTVENYEHDGFRSRDDAYACQQTLIGKLRDQGYKFVVEGKQTFDGARLQRLPVNTHNGSHLNKGFAMPFLDNHYTVVDNGTYLEMRKTGGFPAQVQHGVIELAYPYTCERCRTGFFRSDLYRVWTTYDKVRDYWQEASWCRACGEAHTFQDRYSGMWVADTNEKIEHDGYTYAAVMFERYVKPGIEKQEEQKKRKAPRKPEDRFDLTDDLAAALQAVAQNAEVMRQLNYAVQMPGWTEGIAAPPPPPNPARWIRIARNGPHIIEQNTETGARRVVFQHPRNP